MRFVQRKRPGYKRCRPRGRGCSTLHEPEGIRSAVAIVGMQEVSSRQDGTDREQRGLRRGGKRRVWSPAMVTGTRTGRCCRSLQEPQERRLEEQSIVLAGNFDDIRSGGGVGLPSKGVWAIEGKCRGRALSRDHSYFAQTVSVER